MTPATARRWKIPHQDRIVTPRTTQSYRLSVAIARAVPKQPALYVVATPIGNLADITLRALDILKSVNCVAAEDTRVTGKLLSHYGITVPTLALHQHNERSGAQKILGLLAKGASVALVSDAGTPGISDPGARLVNAVRAQDYPIIPIPGPCAAVTAVSASGFADAGFLFFGFLPAQRGARRRELETLKEQSCATVFYEAPHRIRETLADLTELWGSERLLIIARELTKLFETVHRCALGEAIAWMEQDPNRQRGEFVLVVEGLPPEWKTSHDAEDRVLETLLKELPVKQAVRLCAALCDAPKNALYRKALAIKEQSAAADVPESSHST